MASLQDVDESACEKNSRMLKSLCEQDPLRIILLCGP